MKVKHIVQTMGLLTLCLSNSLALSANPNKAPLDSKLNHKLTVIPDKHAIVEPLPDFTKHNVNPKEKFRPQLTSQKSTKLVAKAACDTEGYATKTGQALVDHIFNQDGTCINDLYDANTTSFDAFQPSKMITVANAAASMALTYSASNGPNNINNLYYFLRTGYFHEFYSPDQVGPYGEDVQSVIRSALDSFVNNADFYANSDQHGKNIQDAIILIDSAGENARYLPMIKEWLNRWDNNFANSWNMRSSVNGIFTVLFRGHYLTEFQTATADDVQLIQSLGKFARSDWMLTSDASYLQENSAGELARFLQYDSAPIYATVKSEVQSLLQRYDMTGAGNTVWIRAATVIDYLGKCSEFNICGFKAELEAQVLAHNHTCSGSLQMRSQDMTSAQFDESCATLSVQEGFFHQMLSTGQTPVADDNNTALEMVIFDSSSDYQSYAGLFFGISTDNGGMYLEGDPADINNQARFIAYEAEWMLPDFHIWNLTHEYVHYLDGRFNLKGDFGDARTGSHKTVWWIEGLAEYISKKNLNDEAITLARTKAFTLSQIFANDYNSGVDRVYRWGYLAVRFMFENHASDVAQMLELLRAGDYDAYLNFINSVSSNYDNEWLAWLDVVESNNTEPTPPNQSGGLVNGQAVTELETPSDNSDLTFYIDVPANATNLTIEMSGGTGDADLYVKYNSEPTSNDYDCRPYKTGNSEVCEKSNPEEGRWYINLKTYQNFSDVSLVATFTETDPAAITPITKGQAQNNLTVANAGEGLLFSLDVPVGATDLNIDISGGTGDADLYVKFGRVPTDDDYDCRPYVGGNNESCSKASPQSGTWYVRVKSYQAFSGLKLLADYTVENTGFDACSTSSPITNGNIEDGVAACIESSSGISYFYTHVDAGTTSLLVELSGGTGNGDLYGNPNTWATVAEHQFSSTQSANSESMTMTVSESGWVYFSVVGNPEHGQTSLRVTHQ